MFIRARPGPTFRIWVLVSQFVFVLHFDLQFSFELTLLAEVFHVFVEFVVYSRLSFTLKVSFTPEFRSPCGKKLSAEKTATNSLRNTRKTSVNRVIRTASTEVKKHSTENKCNRNLLVFTQFYPGLA